MKSIKPGRGPSMMGGISALFAALFGVFWIIVVLQSGGGFFAFFGVIFIAMALVQAWYNFHNASQKDRFSSFDIVDSREEMDPLDPRYAGQDDIPVRSSDSDAPRFCPYCGAELQSDYLYLSRVRQKAALTVVLTDPDSGGVLL